jgi:hypothetical protein
MPKYDISNEYRYQYAAEITTEQDEVYFYCEVEADRDEDAEAVFREFFLYDFPNETIKNVKIVEKIEREI